MGSVDCALDQSLRVLESSVEAPVEVRRDAAACGRGMNNDCYDDVNNGLGDTALW